jgi:hypothetical protein
MSSPVPPDQPSNLSPQDEQYLWNGAGEPAPDVRRVQSALSEFRYTGELRAPRQFHIPRQLLIAASLLLITITSYMLFGRRGLAPVQSPPASPATWTIASTQGDVRIGEPRELKSTVKLREIAVGKDGQVSLRAGKASTVQVESEATLEVADGTNQFPWLTLSSGRAFVQVATGDNPIMVGIYGNAVAVQPGAATAIEATAQSALLTCKAGEAHISWPMQSTRVLGPATCSIDPGRGPALPLPVAAPKDACNAIDALDDSLRYAMKDPKGVSMLLHGYLEQAKPADAPTLWNLLYRVPESFRPSVRDRLAQLIAPVKVNPELILQLDPAAMDAWWKAAVEASTRN